MSYLQEQCIEWLAPEYSKTCVNGHSQRKLVSKTDYRLMQVKSIAEWGAF